MSATIFSVQKGTWFFVAAPSSPSTSVDSGLVLTDVRTLPSDKAGHLVALLYNPVSSPANAASFSLLAAGTTEDGRVSTGIMLTTTPLVPPSGWAVVDLAPDDPAIVRGGTDPADFRLIGSAWRIFP